MRAAPPRWQSIVPCDNLPDNGRVLGRACRPSPKRVDPGGSRLDRPTGVRSSPPPSTASLPAAHRGRSRGARATGCTDRGARGDRALLGLGARGRLPLRAAGLGERRRPLRRRHRARGSCASSGCSTAPTRSSPRWDLCRARYRRRSHPRPALPGCGHRMVGRGSRDLPAGLDLDDYRAALLARFENPRIAHRLEQIAQDAGQRSRVRIAPVLRELERAATPARGDVTRDRRRARRRTAPPATTGSTAAPRRRHLAAASSPCAAHIAPPSGDASQFASCPNASAPRHATTSGQSARPRHQTDNGEPP